MTPTFCALCAEGGALRHGINLAALCIFGGSFPVGTLFINIVGSAIMGMVAEYWAIRGGLPHFTSLFLTAGVLGGFTTFSTFSLDAALLWERGHSKAAAAYTVTSIVLSIAALFAGLWLVRGLDGRGIL